MDELLIFGDQRQAECHRMLTGLQEGGTLVLHVRSASGAGFGQNRARPFERRLISADHHGERAGLDEVPAVDVWFVVEPG